MDKRKIIFLDIDGPINTRKNITLQHSMGLPTSSYYIKLPRKKLQMIKDIIDATGASVVVSSSWRLGSTLSKPDGAMKNFISQANSVGFGIYDYTPIHSMRNRRRGDEITEWLTEFEETEGYCPSYVVIDDDGFDLSDHIGRLIKVSNDYGLTSIDCKKAVYILNNV